MHRSSIEDSEISFKEHLVRVLTDGQEPLKIRKIKFMKELGLCFPETDLFERGALEDFIEVVKRRFERGQQHLIVRFACIPDRFSMPTITIDHADNLALARKEIEECIDRFSGIQYVILREFISEQLAKQKISGRVLFWGERASMDTSVEIFKGSRSTGVLNRADTSDKNFLLFEKKPGQFMKPAKELPVDSSISVEEIKQIFNHLSQFRERLETARAVIGLSKNGKETDRPDVCFEFSFVDGVFLFVDVDY